MNKALFTSNYQGWETPADLIARIKTVYPIDLDLAASRPNICERYYTEQDNAFVQPWDGYRMWLNPTYGRELSKWGKKILNTDLSPIQGLLILVPARATDTKWYDWMTKKCNYVCNIGGRLRFGSAEQWEKRPKDERLMMTPLINLNAPTITPIVPKPPTKPAPAPFPSCLIYRGPDNPRLISLMKEIGTVWKKI